MKCKQNELFSCGLVNTENIDLINICSSCYLNPQKKGVMYVPFQRCPVCDHEGNIEYHDSNRMYTVMKKVCGTCGGSLVIPMAVIPEKIK